MDGEDIKIEEVAEVGVLGTVTTRFIVGFPVPFFSYFAEFLIEILAFGHVVGFRLENNKNKN